MRSGLSFESFAGKIQVNRDTLYEWAKRHTEFSDAKKKAEVECLLFWERLGIAAATGQEIPIGNGKVLDGRKVNTAIWIFNMKCRFRETWREDLLPSSAKEDKVLTMNYARKAKPATKPA